MALSIYTGAGWSRRAELPLSDGAVWPRAKRVWVSKQGALPGTTEWALAEVYDLPDGVPVSISQSQFIGGDVEAQWVNSSATDPIQVEWEVNSNSYRIDSIPAGLGLAILEEAVLSDGYLIRARMRYGSGPVHGQWGPWSNSIIYRG